MKYLIFLFLIQSLSAVTFRIDYTYDTNNFFGDPDNPNDGLKERRDAIEAVAELFSVLIEDELLEIDASQFNQAEWSPQFSDPSSGNTVILPTETVIPANEVVIFVGARDLPNNVLGQAGPAGFGARGFTPWFERIRGRGQEGAEPSNRADQTDTAPWGGQIAFDTPRNWNFSLTENRPGTEFVAVAIHEFCHILGIGISGSWNNLVGANDAFTGLAANNSLNGITVTTDRGHFNTAIPNSSSFGSFNITHGTTQPVLMRAALSDNGSSFNVVSDCDLAALIDIGWEVGVPSVIDNFSVQPGSATLTYPSSTFVDYEFMRSTDLESYTRLGNVTNGDGQINSFTDNSTPANKAFYRLRTTPAFAATSSLTAPRSLFLRAVEDRYREEIEPHPEPIACSSCDTCEGH